MADERIFVVRKVANQLFAVENAIDQALADAADLAAALPRARTEAKLSAVMGQNVLDSAVDVIASLNTARRNIVEMHRHLDETKAQMGLRQVAFGGGMIKPIDMKATPLTVVKTEAA